MAEKTQTAKMKANKKNQVVKKMKNLGVYKSDYTDIINIYVDLIIQYDVLQEQFEQNGYQVTEEYTNKAGATNQRKVPILNALETLRKDIISYSDRLQLNPKSNKEEAEEKTGNKYSFDDVISSLGKGVNA